MRTMCVCCVAVEPFVEVAHIETVMYFNVHPFPTSTLHLAVYVHTYVHMHM